jgi:tetratricopeptide (TPR) repeat protein
MLGRTLRLDYTPESDRRALSAFAEAHRLNRTDVGFLVDYANFRAKQGERDEAELMLFRAFELKRPTSKIQFVIGALGMLYTPDKLDWAIACYDQCLKISPDSTFVQTNYAKVIQLGAVLKPYSWESLTHYIEWTLEEKGLHDKPPAAANTNHGREINYG